MSFKSVVLFVAVARKKVLCLCSKIYFCSERIRVLYRLNGGQGSCGVLNCFMEWLVFVELTELAFAMFGERLHKNVLVVSYKAKVSPLKTFCVLA